MRDVTQDPDPTTCGAVGLDDPPGRCGTPATAYVVYRCAHEHIREGGHCSDHVHLAADQPGIAVCSMCREGPWSHDCPLLLVEVRPAVTE